MTDSRNGSSHPSDEQLAAFLDGSLEGPERSRIVEHLEECDDCRMAITVAAATLAEPPGRGSLHWLGPLVAAAAIVILVVLPASWMSAPENMGAPLRSERVEGTPRFTALQPADGAVSSARPSFRWESAGEGATYELTLTDEVGDVLWSGRTDATTLALPDSLSLPDGSYYWTVDALLEAARPATTGPRRFRVEG